MVSTRRKRYHLPTPRVCSYSNIIEALTCFPSVQSLKTPALKSLYRLLLDLSLRAEGCSFNTGVASERFNLKFDEANFNIDFKEICNLAGILFELLDGRFKQLFSALDDVSATGSYSEILETTEELFLVLRCCMVILNLLVSDQNLLFEKCEVLFSILKRICHLNLTTEIEHNSWCFKKSASHDCIYNSHHCTTSVEEDLFASLYFIESSDSLQPLLSTILEVFADELLAQSTLRKYFFLVNSFSSTTASENLFICHPIHSVMGSVFEVIAAHFLTSFFNEHAFEDFLNRSFWRHEKQCKVPELSLTSGLSLLLNPIILSAPKLLQAHVISLLAEVIGTNVDSKSLTLDQGLTDYYMTAFEKSVILYTRTMSGFQTEGFPVYAQNSTSRSSLYGSSFHQSFESYIRLATISKINHLVTKLENSWRSSLSNMYFRTNADLCSVSTAYMEENHDVLDELRKDEMLLMLQVIVLIASEDVSNTNLFQTMGIESSLQDLCLIASILKLMSSSLLHVLQCVKRSKNMNLSKDLSSCGEYVRILGIISSCFRQFNTHLPIQKILCDAMDSHPTKHKESKLMLLHLSGLLSLSLGIGDDFLLKGCVYTIMLVMNLFIIEEGNVDALRSLLDSYQLKSHAPGLIPEKSQEVNQKASLIIASNFQNVRTEYTSSGSRKKTITTDEMEDDMKESVVETEETCSGKIFLKCILEGKHKEASSDIDNLSDFIECKAGKDYAGWLKGREKYRKYKFEKLAVLKWMKRRSTRKHKNIGLA